MKKNRICLTVFCLVMRAYLQGTTLTITNKTPYTISYQCIDWADERTCTLRSGQKETLQSLSGITCHLLDAVKQHDDHYQRKDLRTIMMQQSLPQERDAAVKSMMGNGSFGVQTGKMAEIVLMENK